MVFKELFRTFKVCHSLLALLAVFIRKRSFVLPEKTDKLRIPNNELYGETPPEVGTLLRLARPRLTPF